MMAAPKSAVLKTLKLIIRELRCGCRKNECVRDLEMYKFVMDQYRKYQVIDTKVCKGQAEMKYLAESYLTYLRSVKAYGEIYEKYHKGERSISETAKLVGLSMPTTYQDLPPDK